MRLVVRSAMRLGVRLGTVATNPENYGVVRTVQPRTQLLHGRTFTERTNAEAKDNGGAGQQEAHP